jgi:hypothetical protein
VTTEDVQEPTAVEKLDKQLEALNVSPTVRPFPWTGKDFSSFEEIWKSMPLDWMEWLVDELGDAGKLTPEFVKEAMMKWSFLMNEGRCSVLSERMAIEWFHSQVGRVSAALDEVPVLSLVEPPKPFDILASLKGHRPNWQTEGLDKG